MAKSIVYREIPPFDQSLLARLAEFGVADLHESQTPSRRAVSLMSPAMRSVVPGRKVVGQAVTAMTVPGDNLVLYAALDVIAAGQVLVMTNGGFASGAMFGDVSASYAQKIGVAGVVVDGPVRDVEALREMSSAVWSTIVSPSHPEKSGPCSVNMPISCAGCIVNPGDIIVADDDAVLVLRPDEIVAVLDAAAQRRDREIGFRRRIADGEHICDVMGFRPALVAADIDYRDGTWS